MCELAVSLKVLRIVLLLSSGRGGWVASALVPCRAWGVVGTVAHRAETVWLMYLLC